MVFRFTDSDVIGFDLDMTLCRYRYFPMVRLVYESLADYLVRKRNYDGLLLDDFTTDEMQLLSRHQIVDFDNLNVKWIESNGNVKSTSNTSSQTSEESTWGHLGSFQEAGVSEKNHFMSMDAIYDVGVSVLVLRLNKLNKAGKLQDSSAVAADIARAYDYIYEPTSLHTGNGLFYPSLKENIAKYIRPITADTKEWLDSMQAAGKTLFLMTSSYADYAKFILSKILVDENGKPIDYWKYFDICIGDARKPDFFLKGDPFCTNKNDYPFEPVGEIKPKTWYSQGNIKTLQSYFNTRLKKPATVCYFGDSMKCDVISANKCGWNTVYLAEELYLESNKSDLTDNCAHLLGSSDYWKQNIFQNSLQWKLALKHASLISPSVAAISHLPPDHEFTEKVYIPSTWK